LIQEPARPVEVRDKIVDVTVIGEVAASFAADPDFIAGVFHFFKQDNACTIGSCLPGCHHP